MSHRWMLNEIARIDEQPIYEPCAEEERGQEIDGYLIAEFVHAKQRLMCASVALKEAHDGSQKRRSA